MHSQLKDKKMISCRLVITLLVCLQLTSGYNNDKKIIKDLKETEMLQLLKVLVSPYKCPPNTSWNSLIEQCDKALNRNLYVWTISALGYHYLTNTHRQKNDEHEIQLQERQTCPAGYKYVVGEGCVIDLTGGSNMGSGGCCNQGTG